jgi:hypothetical protein
LLEKSYITFDFSTLTGSVIIISAVWRLTVRKYKERYRLDEKVTALPLVDISGEWKYGD